MLNGGERFVGHALLCDGTISIKAGQEFHAEKITLLHEIFHGILYFAGHKLQSDENFLEVLSNSVYQLLKDNPELVKYLLLEEKNDKQGHIK